MLRIYTDYSPVKIVKEVSRNFDYIANKLGLTGNYIEIKEEDLPDKKYRDEWRFINEKIEIPENLKESRDSLIRLNEIDKETKFDRKFREILIELGTARNDIVEAEEEAKILRKKIVKW